MTLQELFQNISESPKILLSFFVSIPVLTIIIGFLSSGKGHLSPWKYFYSVIIYLVSIPGIFAVALNVYFFLFQRGDIMQTDIYLQIFPVLVMFATIYLVRKNVPLDYIPGFDRISGLWFILFATMLLMWFLEKIRIFIFSFLPFQYLIGVFGLLFFVIYLGWRRFSR
jgi:hypothetical protein